MDISGTFLLSINLNDSVSIKIEPDTSEGNFLKLSLIVSGNPLSVNIDPQQSQILVSQLGSIYRARQALEAV